MWEAIKEAMAEAKTLLEDDFQELVGFSRSVERIARAAADKAEGLRRDVEDLRWQIQRAEMVDKRGFLDAAFRAALQGMLAAGDHPSILNDSGLMYVTERAWLLAGMAWKERERLLAAEKGAGNGD